MELNYLDRRRSTLGGTILQGFEAYGGYSSASARPWESVKLQVKRVVIDSSWANAGVTNVSYFFNAFEEMVEVVGFQYMSGITSAGQMFGSCPKLETIYATSFSNSGLSGSLMFNGCSATSFGWRRRRLRALHDERRERLQARDWRRVD